MEFVQILFNPTAGKRGKSRRFIEKLIYLLSQQRENVSLYPSKEKGDLTRFFDSFDPEGCKCIFVLGGDGTINEVVNGMMNNGVDVPLFVCPIGTANDFAYYLGIKPDAGKCIEIYNAGKIGGIDIGLANDQYFINICGAGLFMNSTMEFDPAKKAKWGKLAYYAKGVSMVKLLKHYRLRVVTEEREIEDDFFFFAYNMHWEDHTFALPKLPKGLKWSVCFVTCGKNAAALIHDSLAASGDSVTVPDRTVAVLISKEDKSLQKEIKEETRSDKK